MSHNWTWEEINAVWLSGNRLALSQAEIVAAFNRAEQVLGSRWIEKAAINLPGTSSTLRVVSVGQRLSSLDGASGTEELVSKLQANSDSAFAELTGAYLLKSQVQIPMLSLVLWYRSAVATENQISEFGKEPNHGLMLKSRSPGLPNRRRKRRPSWADLAVSYISYKKASVWKFFCDVSRRQRK